MSTNTLKCLAASAALGMGMLISASPAEAGTVDTWEIRGLLDSSRIEYDSYSDFGGRFFIDSFNSQPYVIKLDTLTGDLRDAYITYIEIPGLLSLSGREEKDLVFNSSNTLFELKTYNPFTSNIYSMEFEWKTFERVSVGPGAPILSQQTGSGTLRLGFDEHPLGTFVRFWFMGNRNLHEGMNPPPFATLTLNVSDAFNESAGSVPSPLMHTQVKFVESTPEPNIVFSLLTLGAVVFGKTVKRKGFKTKAEQQLA